MTSPEKPSNIPECKNCPLVYYTVIAVLIIGAIANWTLRDRAAEDAELADFEYRMKMTSCVYNPGPGCVDPQDR